MGTKQMRIGKILNFRIISVILLFVFGVNIKANADDIKFTLTAPQTVEVGENFRVYFELNAKGSDFKEPNLSDFQVISGPNSSSKSSIDWVNGKMVQNITYTYSFILIANNEGEYTIPPAIVKSNGKTYQSNFVDIKVVAGSNNVYTSTNNYQQQNNDILSDNSNDDRFEERYDINNKSKYDDKISWTFRAHSSNDVGDLRAEAQGGWGRFKDAIIGDEIYRGKEYESKSPGEKVFTGIFWADVLQKSRPILLILIVIAIVIFVRRRR